MTTVAIVYQSNHGHTAAVAEALGRGAMKAADTEMHLLRVHKDQIDAEGRWHDPAVMAVLDRADAILFGAPTYMGSAGGLFKLFMEATFDLWFEQRWKDKVASGFANSASQHGDKLAVLFQFTIFAAQHGMIWVPVGDPPGNNWSGGSRNDVNRLGSWLGLMSQSNSDSDPPGPSAGDLLTAERHGERVARIAARWASGAGYQTARIGERRARELNAVGREAWIAAGV
jgi:multimeric flavodoxin WrbA